MGEVVSGSGRESADTALLINGYEIALPKATGERFLHHNKEPLRIDPDRPLSQFRMPGYDVLGILSLPSHIEFLNVERRTLRYETKVAILSPQAGLADGSRMFGIAHYSPADQAMSRPLIVDPAKPRLVISRSSIRPKAAFWQHPVYRHTLQLLQQATANVMISGKQHCVLDFTDGQPFISDQSSYGTQVLTAVA